MEKRTAGGSRAETPASAVRSIRRLSASCEHLLYAFCTAQVYSIVALSCQICRLLLPNSTADW